MSDLPPPPGRSDLPGLTESALQTGRPYKPDVLLVRHGKAFVIVKDYAPRSWWIRNTLGRLATGLEVRAYRALRGHPFVPVFLGRIDAFAFATEYRPGQYLRRRLASVLPKEFLEELEEAVAQMHARGVVHLDLQHRTNVLADPDGHPVLIDFASSLCLRPDGWMARLVLPMLGKVDRKGVRKWRRRLRWERSEASGDARRVRVPRSAGSRWGGARFD